MTVGLLPHSNFPSHDQTMFGQTIMNPPLSVFDQRAFWLMVIAMVWWSDQVMFGCNVTWQGGVTLTWGSVPVTSPWQREMLTGPGWAESHQPSLLQSNLGAPSLVGPGPGHTGATHRSCLFITCLIVTMSIFKCWTLFFVPPLKPSPYPYAFDCDGPCLPGWSHVWG